MITAHRSFASVVLAMACLSMIGTSSAQTARSGGGANVQLLQQLQQMASERTTLQAENERLKKELDGVRKERDALRNDAKAAQQRLARSSAAALAEASTQRAATEQELQRTKDRMQELVVKFRETIQTLRDTETDRADTKQLLESRDQQLRVCVDRNLALYKLNGEILDRLEHRSGWSHVAASEPFTQIARARLENLVDDYKDKAQEQRVTPEALKAAAAGTGTARAPAPGPGGPQSRGTNPSGSPPGSSATLASPVSPSHVPVAPQQ